MTHILRTYGQAPFDVALIHGGPGAGGEMAPVARELAREITPGLVPAHGILEPIQTATTLEGQVEELRSTLETHGDPPVRLIGYSWGAWLSFIVTARYPALVSKLVLVSSGPFEARYAAQLHETRMRRLDERERAEFELTVQTLGDPKTQVDKDALLARLGALASKTDTYDPIPADPAAPDGVGGGGDVFQGVWNDAAEMRRSGALLALAQHIACPVVAIHGDYDPHPAQGVKAPLEAIVPQFRFVLLEHCGHTPWIERQARATFYRVVRQELELGQSHDSRRDHKTGPSI
ncbi:MAG: alpha/beta hydrolase [Anaerolineae bacterium]|nr:alpha/beta hydrolase [Anaerolineae bacterium]